MNDMLTVIRNGLMAKKKRVIFPYSCHKEEIAKLLVREGYLRAVKKKKRGGKMFLAISLKYSHGQPAINEIKSISTPGRRVYLKAQDIKPHKPYAGRGKGLGIMIISTSKGLLTDREASKKNIGGQILFKVY